MEFLLYEKIAIGCSIILTIILVIISEIQHRRKKKKAFDNITKKYQEYQNNTIDNFALIHVGKPPVKFETKLYHRDGKK